MVAECEQPVDGELEIAVQRLVQAFQPDRIYLFGSQARGDATEDSDYDVMVVVPRADEPEHALEVKARDTLRGLRLPIQPFVWPLERFQRQLPVVASFPATIVREGRVLYDNRHAVTQSRRAAANWLPKKADRMRTEREKLRLTKEWLSHAEDDLVLAELAARAGPRRPIVGAGMFHCQQAFEKALKAYLTWRDQPFKKTHDLEELAQQCVGLDPDFAQLMASGKVLDPYVFKFRYPGAGQPGADEFEDALRRAREGLDFVFARVPRSARP